MSNKTLIYIAGPTGVGKTELSINLAKKFNTEIISCDSRQFYKEMQIGTAVPTTAELSEVPHHFIQHKSVEDIYTVGDFEKEAIEKTRRAL
jgi:tRNA dimethylallyltransferase